MVFFIILGSNGVNGQDPPVPDNSTIALSFWDSQQYFYNQTMNDTLHDEDEGTFMIITGISVFGRNGTKPERGGHGGVGGLGGNAGKVFIAGFQQFGAKESNFLIFNKTGKFLFKICFLNMFKIFHTDEIWLHPYIRSDILKFFLLTLQRYNAK